MKPDWVAKLISKKLQGAIQAQLVDFDYDEKSRTRYGQPGFNVKGDFVILWVREARCYSFPELDYGIHQGCIRKMDIPGVELLAGISPFRAELGNGDYALTIEAARKVFSERRRG